MLARGKGFISMYELKMLFGLPEDSEIVRANVSDEGVEFIVVSAKPIEKRTHITEYPHSVRRFRIKNNEYDTAINLSNVGERTAEEMAEDLANGLKYIQDKYNGND